MENNEALETQDLQSIIDNAEGAFGQMLVRNNKKIRQDRAIAIIENTEMLYKRKVEDLQMTLKRLKRDREMMMDLSPTDSNSLVLASDFNAEKFLNKDMEIGMNIRNVEIQLEIAKERYNYLFSNKTTN